MDAIEKLRERLASAKTDTFAVGDVIRWKVDAGREVFVYAAIKSAVGGWFTTAQAHNRFVPQRVSFDDLVDFLSESNVVDVEVAECWEKVR